MVVSHSPRNTIADQAAPECPIAEPSPPTIRTTSTAISQDILVTQVRPSPTNPRQDFDDESMAALTASVAEHGILEPIVVIRRPDATSTYELVAGHRRWLAAGRAGLDRIPARVLLGIDSTAAAKLQAVENLQRQDLNAVEEAQQFRQLADAGVKQAEIARTVGKSQPYVANRMRILELPDDAQNLIRAGQLTPAHGVSLARFSAFPAVASKIGALAVAKGSKVRDLEQPKLPFSWELNGDKLVTQIVQDGATFAACAACPWSAYRADQWYAWCLRPEHADELRAAANAARLRDDEARTTEIKATHPEHHSLPRWSPATQVIRRDPPPGCSDACLCAATAVQQDANGNLSTLDVCTDRERWECLKKEQHQAEREAARQARDTRLGRAIAALDQPCGSSTRALAMVALAALNSVDQVHRLAASKHQADGNLDVKTRPPGTYYEDDDTLAARITANLDMAAAVSADVLIRTAAEAMVRHELQRHYDTYQPNTPIADWLLDESTSAQPAAADEQEADPDDDYPRESDLICERCGEPLEIVSEEHDRRLAATVKGHIDHPVLCHDCEVAPS